MVAIQIYPAWSLEVIVEKREESSLMTRTGCIFRKRARSRSMTTLLRFLGRTTKKTS